MYQIIDFETMKYTTGGNGSKEDAESLNELLASNGLKKLGIIQITATEEIQPLQQFTKVNISEIGNDVTKRIMEKNENINKN